ncbi:guanine nucleotide-binding protein alpha-1 subunit [Reticulomyxa filosa]|uniref:Guanine nucleotide-binding protein alpha-1 subunit n=1 Tax=Reticulomyxa filosa TaxID=46433 RepID=X6NU03_RETFI|nr:guanine nucleotide-binding protein alpha-1 subunit [Reticulomyxa filosa]|eukprot:ETO29269.1 guanine nucleotide-binding protein alpha-1 subunit [Reticulomyxa filosa]
MGCCASGDENSEVITSRMRQEGARDEREQKLVLLGTGESGKSTIFKNLKRIQGGEMVDQRTIQDIRNNIRQNIVEFMVKLLLKSQALYLSDKEKHADCLIKEDQDTLKYVRFMLDHQKAPFDDDSKMKDDILIDLGAAVAFLWKLPAVQATFAKRCGRFSFPDNLEFFFDKALAVMQSDYKPTEDDIIKVRIRTTGYVLPSFLPFFFFFGREGGGGHNYPNTLHKTMFARPTLCDTPLAPLIIWAFFFLIRIFFFFGRKKKGVKKKNSNIIF